MRPKRGMESCLKHIQAKRERQDYNSTRPQEEMVLLVTSIKEPEEREFVVDSGASMHLVSKKDLNSAELETIRISRNPTTVMTANGEVQTREEATVYVKELDKFVTVMFLEQTPGVLSLAKICEDHGYTYHWTSGQKPQLTKKARSLIAIYQTMCHSLSLVCRRVPLHHQHLLRRHLHRRTLYLTSKDTRKIPQPKEVEVRLRSYGDPAAYRPTETKNTNKNEGHEEVQSDLLHELPDWLQEFRENLVDERSP